MEVVDLNHENVVDEKDVVAIATSIKRVDYLKAFEEQGIDRFISSFSSDTKENRMKLYKALNNSDKPLTDMLGQTLSVVDFVATISEFINEETGEVDYTPTLTLFDKNGTSYRISSLGVFRSINSIYQIRKKKYPTVDDPYIVKVVQKKGNNKFPFYTLEYIEK